MYPRVPSITTEPATDGTAITGIGGEPGNSNTATFTIAADRTGLYALRIRSSNPEQAESTPYDTTSSTSVSNASGEVGRTSCAVICLSHGGWAMSAD
jgi:hypothetical protein